jgi:hypothetical protein
MIAPALILLGAILSATGAFWVAYRQQRAAIDRANFERELRAKSDEIAELNRTIARSVTGGDSYAYVNLVPGADGALVHEGRFPLYDVSVRIVDVDKLNAIARSTSPAAAFEQSQVVLKIGNLGAQQAAMIGRWPESDSNAQNLNIFVGARNGFTTQLLRLRRVEGTWRRAMRVRRDADNVILMEKVDPAYPRDPGGAIDWGS